MKKRITHFVGVDEAGRGALAGPVAVGAVLLSRDFDWDLIPGVRDSKQLSPKKREALFRRTQILKKEGRLNYKVSMVSAHVIDKIGISRSIQLAVDRALTRLHLDRGKTHVKLDGLLRAPERFIHQKTMVKGDTKEKVIGLASIMAKVTRDRYMVRLARKYPKYGFDAHKGYGTRAHKDSLIKFGRNNYHRRTFTSFTPERPVLLRRAEWS